MLCYYCDSGDHDDGGGGLTLKLLDAVIVELCRDGYGKVLQSCMLV